MIPPKSENEEARLEALRRYNILDTAPEDSFDSITQLASFIGEVPIALISLVDNKRQWFKSKVGLNVTETDRDSSFCAHTVHSNSMLVVEDATLDERFADNPLVTGDPSIRFYAGAPLITSEGHVLGSLCMIDRIPRRLSAERAAALEKLAGLVVTLLELRQVSMDLAEAAKNIKKLNGLLPICSYCKSIRNDEQYWQGVEMYIETHTEAALTHGICPDCTKSHFPEIYDQMETEKQGKQKG